MRSVSDVDDRAVLNVRAIPYAYVEDITTHDRVEPDGRLLADLNVADNLRALFDKSRLVNLRVRAAKWSDHGLTLVDAPANFALTG